MANNSQSANRMSFLSLSQKKGRKSGAWPNCSHRRGGGRRRKKGEADRKGEGKRLEHYRRNMKSFEDRRKGGRGARLALSLPASRREKKRREKKGLLGKRG